jgi:hypothetical protein
MSGRVPVWRSPQIAPVYALVLAFAAVAVTSWIFAVLAGPAKDREQSPGPDKDARTVTLKVSGEDLPKDLRIARGRTAAGAPVGDDGTVQVAAGADELCLRSAEPVRVAGDGEPTDCVSGTATAIQVRHVVVKAMSGDEPSRGGVVTVDGKNVHLDQGRYLPDRSLVGHQVCFTPAAGSTVVEPPAGLDGKSCIPPKDPLADVVFKVVGT